VVSFLATLELVKERLVVVTQNEAFAPIYVKRADSATGDA
jgi:segregation and condensation protein A